MPVRVVSGIIVCRLLVLPLIGSAIIIGARAAGAFTAPDPIFLLVMLIQVHMITPAEALS